MCSDVGLRPFLDLGLHPLADRFLSRSQLSETEPKFPLRAALCPACGLVQLDYVVERRLLYQDEYPYESSMTATGRGHFRDMAVRLARARSLPSGALVVDVGSNVGVLLRAFTDLGARAVGIEPARNIAELARAQGVECVADFFGAGAVDEILSRHGRASIVTGTNVFAHVDDLEDFVENVRRLLAPGGVLVIEAPYLAELIEKLEYDTIYHEHLSYLSVRPMADFFERRGMRLVDVERVSLHGGSLRYFVEPTTASPPSPRVGEFLELERRLGVHELGRLERFSEDVRRHRDALRELVGSLKRSGKRLAGVSAPAKGNTLLNFCGIGRDHLDYLTEVSTLKQGRFAPGTHLPVVADERLLTDRPDFGVLLAWNFAAEIRKNLAAFERSGGRFILPLPSPCVL
jgi:SAM-dependent methyltransferase